MFIKSKLKNALRYYRYHLPALNNILDTFELNNYEYALVGGFVKNIMTFDLHAFQEDTCCRDLDIIVNLPKKEIEYILRHYHILFHKNDFGGFKVVDRQDATFNMDLDIWSLEDHQPFKVLPPKDRNWKGIRKSGWLSVCGATYLPQTNKLYASGLRKSIKHKYIEMYNPEIYFSKQIVNKYIVVAKLLDYLYSGWKIDSNCSKAIRMYLNSHPDIQFLSKYLDSHSKNYFADWEEFIKTIGPLLNETDD